jgi:hypothetical protein
MSAKIHAALLIAVLGGTSSYCDPIPELGSLFFQNVPKANMIKEFDYAVGRKDYKSVFFQQTGDKNEARVSLSCDSKGAIVCSLSYSFSWDSPMGHGILAHYSGSYDFEGNDAKLINQFTWKPTKPGDTDYYFAPPDWNIRSNNYSLPISFQCSVRKTNEATCHFALGDRF